MNLLLRESLNKGNDKIINYFIKQYPDIFNIEFQNCNNFEIFKKYLKEYPEPDKICSNKFYYPPQIDGKLFIDYIYPMNKEFNNFSNINRTNICHQIFCSSEDFIINFYLNNLEKIKNYDIIISCIIYRGNLNLLKLFYNKIKNINLNICYITDLDILKFIEENREIKNDLNEILKTAAKNGKLDIIKYLVNKYSVSIDDEIFNNSVCSGNIELVKYLIDKFKYINFTEETFRKACNSDNLEIVKLIDKNDIKISSNYALFIINRLQSLEIFNYIINSKKIKNKKILIKFLFNTCKRGKLNDLKYISENYDFLESVNIIRISFKHACYSENSKLINYMMNKFHKVIINYEPLYEIITHDIYILHKIKKIGYEYSDNKLLNCVVTLNYPLYSLFFKKELCTDIIKLVHKMLFS